MTRLHLSLLCASALIACNGKSEKKAKSAETGETSTTEAVQGHGPGKLEMPGLAPVRLPGDIQAAPFLEGATRVAGIESAAGPLIVAAGNGWLRWFDKDGAQQGELLTAGAAQVLEVFDFDGNGTSEIVIGRGLGRDAADGPLSLQVVYLPDGKKQPKPRVEVVALPESPRAQVVAVAMAPGAVGELWAASFVNKYEVEVARYQRGESASWSLVESRGRHRVVGDLTIMPDGTPVIARFYGDTSDADGGVYALPPEGPAIALPSTRGARAVLALPGPEFQLAMADGWHKEYGRKALGLITVIAKAEQGYTTAASVRVKDNYGFNQLRLSHLHRDPGAEILASGNGPAVVMLPTRPDLLFELGGVEAEDAFPIQLFGDERMEVVIAGPSPAIWTPR